MPLRTHERPNLPYEALPKRNNQRYQLLSARDQPPTAEMLDSDVDYVIDSLDVLSQDIQNVQAGKIVGSDNPINANKLLTTDGNSVGWTLVRSSNMEDTAVTRTKIAPSAVSTDKLENGSITHPKLGLLSVGLGNMKDTSVGVAQIINKNVTTAKLADRAVTEDKVGELAISNSKLKSRCVTNEKMGDACVDARTIQDGTITAAKLASQVLKAAIFPTGSILPYAAPYIKESDLPAGWLFCNGRSLYRLGYPHLFSIIGTTYGARNDTHFNLPDLRGRAIFGCIENSTGDRVTKVSPRVGKTGGAETHKLSIAEMPRHSHNYIKGNTYTYQAGHDQRASYPDGRLLATTPQGSSSPHNNMPPFIFMNYIIKT